MRDIRIQQHNMYRCRINVRPEYYGHKVKESVAKMNGVELDMYCAWIADDNERYEGEHIMIPKSKEYIELFSNHDTAWLASGDVEVLEEL